MLYIILTAACIVGYFVQRIGSKKEKKLFIRFFGKEVWFNVLQLIGWILMEGCAVAALVCFYGFRL